MCDRRYLGIGHPFRCDDGVGPWIAERLAEAGLPSHVHTGDGAALLERFGAAADWVVFDATAGGGRPGSVTRIDARRAVLPRGFFRNSTHEFGLAEAVEVARRLGTLPRALLIVGIEGAEFSHGTSLTPEVSRAAEEIVREFLSAPAVA